MSDDLPGGTVGRREMLAALGLAALAAACDRRSDRREPGAASAMPGANADVGAPEFFTPHELATVTLLADMVIPRDERSGSASDAGAPVYMDFALREVEHEPTRVAFRGGLAWLDTECRERFGRNFVECGAGDRAAVLDDIAFPRAVRPELAHGARFFTLFRDLLATAFWSSEMGVRDLRYSGGVALPAWEGCPEEALRPLGVRYG